jgi:hypothetical protein
MVQTIEAQSGQMPDRLLADSGCRSEQNIDYLANKGIDAYITPEGQKHGTRVEK